MALVTKSVSDHSQDIYTTSEMMGELRQAEILSGVQQYIFDDANGKGELTAKKIGFSIVVTQDCDLVQEYNRRNKGLSSDINGILLFEAQEAAICKAQINGSDIWKRIKQNKDERYHLLERVAPCLDLDGLGLPALVIDFKRLYSIVPQDLYAQILNVTAARRTRLEMPFREHLQTRACYFMQRIMLPRPHNFD